MVNISMCALFVSVTPSHSTMEPQPKRKKGSLLRETDPHVYAQISELNDLSEIDKSFLTYGMDVRLWWKCDVRCCETEHVWRAQIKNRTIGEQGCPFCALNGVTCICKSLASKYPDKAVTLHPTMNGDIDLRTIPPSSHKPLWWLEYCGECGTELPWIARPYNRIKTEGGSTLCVCRSLGTLDPELAQQIDQKLSPCDPMSVAANSNDEYYWKCDKHDSWTSAVFNRYSHRKGCPGCNASKLENAMHSVLKKMGLIFKAQVSLNGSKQKFDFAVYSDEGYTMLDFLIELDGTQHFEPTTFGSKKNSAKRMFQDVRKRDLSKDLLSRMQSVSLLRIAYTHSKENDMQEDLVDFMNTKDSVNYVLMCAGSDVYDKRDEKYGNLA
jgi:hypothetical protein